MLAKSLTKSLARFLTTHQNELPTKPWNYKKYGYNSFYAIFDGTMKRMNENSKVVVVCGNIGIGKDMFTKKFAKLFNLCYFADPDYEQEGFKLRNGLDLRQFDEQLPKRLQTYSLSDWFSDPSPGIKASKIQTRLYDLRFSRYVDSLAHLFNTGQGVVLNSSVWSDRPVAAALHSHGFISSDAMKYYDLISSQSLCSLIRPHLTIFLDCSPQFTMELIRRNRPESEVNSGILNEELIGEIHKNYLEMTLPLMKKYGEVLVVDWQDFLKHSDPDFEMKLVASDVEKIDLDSFELVDLHKFRDWRKFGHVLAKKYRLRYSDPQFTRRDLIDEIPWDCEELRPNEADFDLWWNVVTSNSGFTRFGKYINYPPGMKSFFRLEL